MVRGRREISFYGRVTNLRTRHCRVPADARTMRLRNTMLHSGNLKAVLTTNLQPPMPPPHVLPSAVSPFLFPICVYTNTLSFDTYHPSILMVPVVTFSFFCPYPSSRPLFKFLCPVTVSSAFLSRVTVFKFTFVNLQAWQTMLSKFEEEIFENYMLHFYSQTRSF